jgi:hypothetical protein
MSEINHFVIMQNNVADDVRWILTLHYLIEC